MPHHPDTAVAKVAARLASRLVTALRLYRLVSLRGAQRFLHRDVYGVELVVARHLLRQSATTGVLEHDEVADEVEKPTLLEHTLEDDLQFRDFGPDDDVGRLSCARA